MNSSPCIVIKSLLHFLCDLDVTAPSLRVYWTIQLFTTDGPNIQHSLLRSAFSHVQMSSIHPTILTSSTSSAILFLHHRHLVKFVKNTPCYYYIAGNTCISNSCHHIVCSVTYGAVGTAGPSPWSSWTTSAESLVVVIAIFLLPLYWIRSTMQYHQ